jgi:DNA-nicking Smr family endonuclease
VTGGRGGDDDDDRAFAEAMRGAMPLDPAERRRRAQPVPPSSTAAASTRPGRPVAGDETGAFRVASSGESIAGRAAGIDARLLRRLRAGDYPIEATLDLHGRRAAAVGGALERLVAAAQAQGRRCVLVVHGRGQRSPAGEPVLKPAVWQWLTSSPAARAAVMAFCSARPEQGGSGATLLLLRRA